MNAASVYSVELNQDANAVKLRKRLDAAGIDTEAIEKTLNGGEPVVPSPAVTILPSPLPHDVWESRDLRAADRAALTLQRHHARPASRAGLSWAAVDDA